MVWKKGTMEPESFYLDGYIVYLFNSTGLVAFTDACSFNAIRIVILHRTIILPASAHRS